MGRHAEAEPLYQQAMEIRRTALGERHPDYATSLNNLAVLYDAMGRHAEAEPLYRQAMEIRRTALGERHPDYAASLNNLAVLYRRDGPARRGRAALPAGDGDSSRGPGRAAPRLRHLAEQPGGAVRAMGRHAEAEPLYLQAMEIRRIALGERHPDYATSLNNLAALYRAMGRHAEAEPLYLSRRRRFVASPWASGTPTTPPR